VAGSRREYLAADKRRIYKIADRKGISVYTDTIFGLSINFKVSDYAFMDPTVRKRTTCLIFRPNDGTGRQCFFEKEIARLRQDLVGLGELKL
jgi:hypothetical protein